MIFIAAVALLLAVLQPVVNHVVIPRLVEKYSAEYLDADVDVSDIRLDIFGSFPVVKLSVDGLRIRAERDTLLSAGHVEARANLIRLARKDYHLLSARIDSLGLNARATGDSCANWNVVKGFSYCLPVESWGLDSLGLRVDGLNLKLRESVGAYGLEGDLSAVASAGHHKLGVVDVPLSLNTALDYKPLPEGHAFSFDFLDLVLAGLPLHADGDLSILEEGIPVDVNLDLDNVAFREFIRDYATIIMPELRSFPADIFLSADAHAKGEYISGKAMPRVDLNVRRLSASLKGAAADVSGNVRDALGRDPRIKLYGNADAELATLVAGLHLDSLYMAKGRVHLSLDANTRKSELQSYRFERSSLKASLESGNILFGMPGDTISAEFFRPTMHLNSGKDGITAFLGIDSLYFEKGADMAARVRDMRNNARLFSVESRGKKTPRMEYNAEGRGIFLRAGDSRVGLRGYSVGLQAQKRVKRDPAERKRFFDSLKAAHGDSLRAMRKAMTPVDEVLARSDVKLSLDSSITKMIRDWNPTGQVDIARGFLVSPAIPIRTRIAGLKGQFDGDVLNIDTLGITSGTSDISLRGKVKGLRRTLLRKGFIDTHLDLYSKRLNINEIIAAIQAGQKIDKDTIVVKSENDESFVVDSIADAKIEMQEMKVFLLPGNVDLRMHMLVDKMDVLDIQVEPLRAGLHIKDRIAQLNDAQMKTNVGNIDLSAYYSTKSLDDIDLGVNMNLEDMNAHSIISIVPNMDNMLPALKSFEGLFDCHLSMATKIDTNFNAIIPSMNAVIRLNGDNLLISETGDLKRIMRLLMFKDKKKIKVDHLAVNAVAHDSRLEIFPFELNVDRYRLALQGMQNFDRSMYYHMSVLKSPMPFKFGIDIFGSLDDWHFSLARAKYTQGRVPAFTQELDMMQFNILGSIKDVFQKGVHDVQEYNEQLSKIDYDRDSKPMDAKEYGQVDALLFHDEHLSDEEAVAKEVDAVLEASSVDIDEMLKSYQTQSYTKKQLRFLRKNKK